MKGMCKQIQAKGKKGPFYTGTKMSGQSLSGVTGPTYSDHDTPDKTSQVDRE